MIKDGKKKRFKLYILFIALTMTLHTVFLLSVNTYAARNQTETTRSSYSEESELIEKNLNVEKEISENTNSSKKPEETTESTSEQDTSEEPVSRKGKNSVDGSAKEKNSSESSKTKRSGISILATKVWEGERSDYGNLTFCLWSNQTASVLRGDKIANNSAIRIPTSIEHQGVKYEVIKIKENAFLNSTKIKSLSFEENSNMQIIENDAFNGCTNLEKVYIGNCRKLTNIQARAFRGCSKLDYISFINCDSLVEIGEAAFRLCNLTSLDFGNISKLKTIGESAFRDCESLGGKTIRIPDSVTTINQHAFMNETTKYGELHHKKIAEVNGTLPSLTVEPIALPEDAKNYESKVDSSKNKTLLHKAAKWTDDNRTQAEIRLDYGYNFDRLANVDLIFVMDYSSSMLIPTSVKKNNITYNFPRAYLTDDIVCGASEMILDNSPEGYNNRVAFVAFGGGEVPLYSSEFMTTAQQVKDYIVKSPACGYEDTKYNTGLQGAINIFKKNKDPNRQQAVIFLSDGQPNKGRGLVQAQELRDEKINVYPIAMYAEEGTTEALKNISYDEKTVYVADDTDSFEKIMGDVVKDVINHAEPLTAQLEDVLAKDFELPSGLQADFETSTDGGKVTTSSDGRKIHWDLKGCAQGIAHTLKIKVKLGAGTEFSASGILPTNDSLKAVSEENEGENLTAKDQPKLDRYLAHHEFKNETFPNTELPEEVRKLLPLSRGGFANNTLIKVDGVTNKVRTKEGQWWEFLGWDKAEATIAGKDVLFSGKWRYVGYDFSFIKQNEDGEGLSGAEFSLYVWKGGSAAPGEKELVTEESLAAGKWQLISTQSSQPNGRVDFLEVPVQVGKYFQLVETKAPEHYRKPQGQWRFSFSAEDGFIENDQIVSIPSQDNEQPPKFEKIQEGEHQGMWCVLNKHAHGELPATGGRGTASFAIGAFACGSIGISGLGVFYLYDRKKRY